jgi:hypothetical protein
MANIQNSNEPANQIDEDPSNERRPQATEGEEEFQITVKKLDFVVKPRGVLAE